MFYKKNKIGSIFKKNSLFFIFCCVFCWFSSPISIKADNYQRCELNENCVIGEYLFDNSGNLITQQACVINIKNPSGAVLVENANMDFEGDGWHSYNFSASNTKGIYRSLMCCTVGSDSACLDKSFILGASLDSLESDTEFVRNSTFDFSGLADSGSTTTTLIDSELNRPDNYWNNYTLVMITGNNAGEERVITGFNSTTHSLSFSPFSQAINEGDRYILRRDSSLIIGIWNYANRTLSSIANVAGDIWGYSGRTLSSIGVLAADIWDNNFAPNRNLTSENLVDGGKLATETNIETTKTELLAELGVIETNLSSTDLKIDTVLSNTVYIETKIDGLKTDLDALNLKTNEIYDDVSDVSLGINDLLAKWETSDVSDILNAIELNQNLLGTVMDDSNVESVFGRTKYLMDKWGIQTAQSIFDNSDEIISKTNAIREELGYEGKTDNAYNDLQAVKSYINNLELLIGNPEDLASISTIFGKIKDVNNKVSTLNEIEINLVKLIEEWGDYDVSEVSKLLENINNQVKKINSSEINDRLSSLTKKINEDLDETKLLQNRAIEIRAMVDLNRSLIENKPVIKTFYEWGSIVFKIVIANPSEKKQVITFRSALPKEIQPKNLINKDADLNLEFDAEKDRWFVSSEIEIAGNQSITKFVQVADIWKIDEDEIKNLKNEASELSKVLENSNSFAQGVIIKNDISNRLDKILLIQKQDSITPEEHILNYRTNLLEIETAKKNLDSLKTLAVDNSNNNNFKGSLLGVSTVMTWSIILVVIVGVGVLLIFLVVALRSKKEISYNQERSDFFDKYQDIQSQKNREVFPEKNNTSNFSDKLNLLNGFIFSKKEIFLRIIILIVLIIFLIIGANIYRKNREIVKNNEEIIVADEEKSEEIQEMSVIETTELIEIEEELDELEEVIEIESDETEFFKKVKIKETEIGWLNVREKAGTEFEIIERVDIGSEFEFLEMNEEWIKIKLKDGREGWLNSQYAEIINENEE